VSSNLTPLSQHGLVGSLMDRATSYFRKEVLMATVDHVNNDQKVSFKFYQKGSLFYETQKGLVFEVPATETGTGQFKSEDKAIAYMKWIARQIKANEEMLKKD
jgi:hypothetical protein